VTLRITREEGSGSGALLRAEGRLVASWAVLLEGECVGLLQARNAVSLDLAGVDFVDSAGVDALKRLSRRGIVIRCRCGPVASVLEAEGVRVTPDVDDPNDRRP